MEKSIITNRVFKIILIFVTILNIGREAYGLFTTIDFTTVASFALSITVALNIAVLFLLYKNSKHLKSAVLISSTLLIIQFVQPLGATALLALIYGSKNGADFLWGMFIYSLTMVIMGLYLLFGSL